MVCRVAQDAGALLYEYFEAHVPGMEDSKADGSPVTAADHAAEELIAAALAELVPGVPLVAEEAVAAGRVPDLSGEEYFWLVDPLDGTKAFVKGEPDFTVNIALIRNGEPVIGVIYAPVKGELYSGHGPGTALRALDETGSEKEITIRPAPAAGLVVMASGSHGDKGKLDSFHEAYKVAKMVRISSSLKFCALACGKADMYPRFGPTCEWDTAAGDAILRAAGGGVYDLSGTPLRYGKAADKFINPEFVACERSLLVPDDH